MATGTEAGLTRDKKAQSVFKHKILERYVLPYAAMTASICTPKRCVVVDGFAGRGRYDDGSAASAERMMVEAHKLTRATLDVFAIEKKRSDFEHLDAVADEWRARGVIVTTRRGKCQDHLDEIVEFARGASMLLFLDPCGANIPMDDLTSVLSGPRSSRYPPTEALLNINADIIRRTAGVIYKRGTDENTDALDTMCGGQWWREVAIEAYEASGKVNWEAAADAVVEEYAKRAAKASHTGWVVASVHRKEGHQAVYYLVLLTRDPHGFWVFGNAHAKARYDWLQFLANSEEEKTGQAPLMTVQDQEKQEQTEYAAQVRSNIEAMIASGVDQFIPVRRMSEIFGETYGAVEEKTVHAALRQLVKDGRLEIVDKKPKPYATTYAVVS